MKSVVYSLLQVVEFSIKIKIKIEGHPWSILPSQHLKISAPSASFARILPQFRILSNAAIMILIVILIVILILISFPSPLRPWALPPLCLCAFVPLCLSPS